MPFEEPARLEKHRHGCLTAWLCTMAAMSVFAALVYSLAGGFLLESLPGAPAWMIYALGALATLNIVFAIALWNWKKWGVWGYCATSAAAFVINWAMGTGIGSSLMGLLGPVILFAALLIGRQRKGWPQLE